MRRVALAVSLAVLGGGAAPATASAPGACAERDVIISQETLSVEVEPPARPVRAGRTARFEVTVSRPGRIDPTGSGPAVDLPALAPASEVLAATWIGLEPYAVATVEQTGTEGETEISVPIPKNARPGTYDVRGFAWNVIVSGCVTLEEVGAVQLPGALEVTKARKGRR